MGHLVTSCETHSGHLNKRVRRDSLIVLISSLESTEVNDDLQGLSILVINKKTLQTG